MADVVTLDYNDLVSGRDLTEDIGRAFGMDGNGLLTVKNVPLLVDSRSRLLPLAQKFASLPDEVKAKYVHDKSSYSFGWSHGKEKLQGVADISKGSYYANPQYDDPTEGNQELIDKYSSFVHPNIWPNDDMPELETAFKELGQLIVSVGKLVAAQCDRYVHSINSSYTPNCLRNILDTSLCCKARLLHYYAKTSIDSQPSDSDLEFSSWCGWHNDHGSLTGLVSALFLNEKGEEVSNPDPSSGLYIRNRKSELRKINIPKDHIAFQIGETAQIHSGGILQATPHAVRGANDLGISRETFAVFMEPNWSEPMIFPEGATIESVQSQSSAASLPKGVPPLKVRWNPSQTFGDFTDSTLSMYY